MAVQTNVLGAITAITLDISGLAGDTNLLAGVESTEVAGNDAFDYLVNIDPIAGHLTTAPVIGQLIEVWAWGSDVSLGSISWDTLVGVSAPRTLSNASAKFSMCLATASSVSEATANLTYLTRPFTISKCFGGIIPAFWGLFIVHNQAGALGAAQTASFSYQTVTPTSV